MIRVLVLVNYFLPGYKAGGAMRTIVNVVEQLGQEIDFSIITRDRDLGDTVPYPDVAVDTWCKVGNARVFYTSPSQQSIACLARLIRATPHDVLYLNSIFDSVFTLRPLLARRFRLLPDAPLVLAPRGELSAGALELKWWKKALYLLLTRAAGLYRGLRWQASSDYEAAEIRHEMDARTGAITVAPDLSGALPVASIAKAQVPRTPGQPLRVCFLSRISPKKNLDFALRVLGEIATPLQFDIFGPRSDETYWESCEALIRRVNKSVVVRYMGSVEHDRVLETIGGYDLFFLPTRGENFGHVILESMMAGTPVLISDTTPWRDLERLGVGWDLPLSRPEAFTKAILSAATIGPAEYANWRNRVRTFAIKTAHDVKILDANRRMFTEAVAARPNATKLWTI